LTFPKIVPADLGHQSGVGSTIAGFAFANKEFEGATKYSDWKFLYNPAAQQVPIPQQGAAPGTQQVPISQQPTAPETQQAPIPQRGSMQGTM